MSGFSLFFLLPWQRLLCPKICADVEVISVESPRETPAKGNSHCNTHTPMAGLHPAHPDGSRIAGFGVCVAQLPMKIISIDRKGKEEPLAVSCSS